MSRALFILIALIVPALPAAAKASSDFGSPFTNQVPLALGGTPFSSEVADIDEFSDLFFDIEPAAGDEMEEINANPAIQEPPSRPRYRGDAPTFRAPRITGDSPYLIRKRSGE